MLMLIDDVLLPAISARETSNLFPLYGSLFRTSFYGRKTESMGRSSILDDLAATERQKKLDADTLHSSKLNAQTYLDPQNFVSKL